MFIRNILCNNYRIAGSITKVFQHFLPYFHGFRVSRFEFHDFNTDPILGNDHSPLPGHLSFPVFEPSFVLFESTADWRTGRCLSDFHALTSHESQLSRRNSEKYRRAEYRGWNLNVSGKVCRPFPSARLELSSFSPHRSRGVTLRRSSLVLGLRVPFPTGYVCSIT